MQNLGNMQCFFANIFVHTVLNDLLLLFMCHRHVNNCIQLSTLRGATISNTVLVYTTDFLSSTAKFINTSTVTRRILVTEKTTRTPRVHLVIYKMIILKFYIKNGNLKKF